MISSIKPHNPPFLLSDKIVFFNELLKDKQASSVLSQEIVPSYSLKLQRCETRLHRRQPLLPVAYLLNNRIVTLFYNSDTAC